MRAIQTAAPGHLALTELPTPAAGPGELVIEVKACGICGTDMHIADGEFPPAPYPIVQGHEFAGVISGVGDDSAGFCVGDRVAVDPSLFCGSCRYCRSLRGNLCERWGAIGDTCDGGFAEFVTVPASSTYHMPPGLTFGAAALVEPTSCAVHALDRLGVQAGSDVLIYGAGTMGLILAQLLRHVGAGTVTLLDRNESRLAQAKRFGFVSLGVCLSEVKKQFPDGFDRVVDATGVAAAIGEALTAVRKGGTFMVFGVAPAGEKAAFEPFTIYNQEITIVGSMAVLASYGRALDLMSAGAIDAEKMVTNQLGFEHFEDAFRFARDGVGLKTQLVP